MAPPNHSSGVWEKAQGLARKGHVTVRGSLELAPILVLSGQPLSSLGKKVGLLRLVGSVVLFLTRLDQCDKAPI